MSIIHHGVALNQQQLDAIVPVLNEVMDGKHQGKKRLEAAIDRALEAAGCPVHRPDNSHAEGGKV